MYLEVSGRRMGKTKRITDIAMNWHDRGIDFTLTGVNINLYPEELHRHFIPNTTDFAGIEVLLCDEFELCLKNTSLDIANMDKWVVAGTPYYSMSNILKKLIKQQPMYCSYINYPLRKQMLNDIADFATHEYNSQVLGRFLDND